MEEQLRLQSDNNQMIAGMMWMNAQILLRLWKERAEGAMLEAPTNELVGTLEDLIVITKKRIPKSSSK